MRGVKALVTVGKLVGKIPTALSGLTRQRYASALTEQVFKGGRVMVDRSRRTLLNSYS